MNAALTLNWFGKECDHVRVVAGDLANGLDVVAWRPDKTAHQGLKASLDLLVTGSTQGGERAAVKSAFQNDNGSIRYATIVAVQASEFYCRFVGFSAGVTEEAFLHARRRAQSLGELFLRANAIKIRGMYQFVGLLANRSGHAGVSVT